MAAMYGDFRVSRNTALLFCASHSSFSFLIFQGIICWFPKWFVQCLRNFNQMASHRTRQPYYAMPILPIFGITGDNKFTPTLLNQETEGFLLNAVNMSFFERLNIAWKILFPSTTTQRKSNANIAKKRLKMILFSDRCAVSDEAKQKIVSNIVGALSDF
ncbi:hypothetical protein MKW92_015567, partial [Papaver armeniacum]